MVYEMGREGERKRLPDFYTSESGPIPKGGG